MPSSAQVCRRPSSRNNRQRRLHLLLPRKARPSSRSWGRAATRANEQRLIGEDLSTAEFLTGASYKWTISPTADFTDDYDFSVSFSDAGDWRNANIATLTAKLTTLFSLKLSNIARYVHEPVFGFENTDTITSIALVAKL